MTRKKKKKFLVKHHEGYNLYYVVPLDIPNKTNYNWITESEIKANRIAKSLEVYNPFKLRDCETALSVTKAIMLKNEDFETKRDKKYNSNQERDKE